MSSINVQLRPGSSLSLSLKRSYVSVKKNIVFEGQDSHRLRRFPEQREEFTNPSHPGDARNGQQGHYRR